MKKISKDNREKLINRLWFFAGLILFLLLSAGLTREIVNRRQINRQINDYQQKINQLNAENDILKERIDNWSASGELELNARTKLGLEKPGEKTIIINHDEESRIIKSNQEIINLPAANLSGEYQSNPVKWWKYFFN